MTEQIPMLDLVRLHQPIAHELRQEFDRILDSGRFILGPNVERFETLLAHVVGAGHSIGVSSGTDALLITLMGLDVEPGDEVITTAYSFFASAGAIARLGAKPVFVDIEPVSFNADQSLIAAAVTEHTVGVLPVHLFGQCAAMNPILQAAARRGLWVVEDAAQALGATYHDRPAGAMGLAAAHSFFPSKNLGALGDAGAVTTGDDRLANRVRVLREHGAAPKYHHAMIGGNFRLDALQAALLAIKLPLVTKWETGRRRAASRYEELLGDIDDLVLPAELEGRHHVFNQYVIRVCSGRRDAVRDSLTRAEIGCAVYYPKPLHLQPCFSNLGYREGDLPQSERAARESLAIPIDPHLTQDDQERIALAIRDGLSR